MKTIRNAFGLVMATVLLAGAFGATSVSAQIYPQPEGYCATSLSDPLPPLGADITLVVTAADRAGTPIVGDTGSLVITDQPGDSARLTPATFVTGADGTATVVLTTGDVSGRIAVAGECDEVIFNATVQVGTPPGPPATGSGPSEDGTGVGALLALSGLAIVGAGAGVRVMRRRA